MGKHHSRSGKKAHSETIIPSHNIFERIKRKEFPNKSVTQSIGVPDIIVYGKGTRFYEIKPHRVVTKDSRRHLGGKRRRFLSKDQENTTRRLLKEGQGAFMVFYVKYKRKSRDRFVYREKELNLKNLKRFCLDSKDDRKYDADKLFWDE